MCEGCNNRGRRYAYRRPLLSFDIADESGGQVILQRFDVHVAFGFTK